MRNMRSRILVCLAGICGAALPGTATPSVWWTSAPAEVQEGDYYIEAEGSSDRAAFWGVEVWREGQPFAYGEGGYDSPWGNTAGNWATDMGEQWIAYSAEAYDTDGDSGIIYHTVHVKPANTAPTVWWTSAPAVVDRNATYQIRADGHDNEGNMTGIHIYKDDQPFAFELNGNGTDANSENLDSTSGEPGSTITYKAEAHDSYASSGYIYHTVTINNHLPFSWWDPTRIDTYINSLYSFTGYGSDEDNNLKEIRIYQYAWEDVGGTYTLRQNYVHLDTVTSTGGPVSKRYDYIGGKPWKWNYQYVVMARDRMNYDSFGPWAANTLNVYLDNRIPVDPTLSSAQTTIGLGQSVVISSYSSDLDSNLTGHLLWYQGPDDESYEWHTATQYTSVQGDGSTTISYTFTPTQLGTYKLKTRANDPYVSTVDITVTLAVVDATPPLPPTNVQTDGAFTDRIQVKWNLSTSTDVAKYLLYWKPSAGGTESSVELGINVTAYWVLNLTNDTSYDFYLKAHDGAGNGSNPSNTATDRTAYSEEDFDGDGVPDHIEVLFGPNWKKKGTTDVNGQLKVHKP